MLAYAERIEILNIRGLCYKSLYYQSNRDHFKDHANFGQKQNQKSENGRSERCERTGPAGERNLEIDL